MKKRLAAPRRCRQQSESMGYISVSVRSFFPQVTSAAAEMEWLTDRFRAQLQMLDNGAWRTFTKHR